MPSSRPCQLLTIACCLLGSLPVHGMESPYFEELPHVLSATRLPQPRHEVPGAVTVIDRELIAATGYRDLARVLRLVPGMQIGQERGHSHWVTYHGLSSDYPTEMQVLIDGRSVINGSAFGGVDWTGLPLTLDEIDRIEVVRGTNASSFGANAFLGIINIITRHSVEDPGVRVKLRGGDDRIRDATFTWSGGEDPLTVRATAVTQRDDGFDGMHDSRRTDAFSVRGDLQFDASNSLLVRFAGNRGSRGNGYKGSVFDNNGPRHSTNRSHDLHLQWQHNGSADVEWLLNYYRNHERVRDEWFASAPPVFPAVPLNRNRENVRDSVGVQRRSTPATDLQLVWGLEAQREDVDAPFLYYGGNPDPQYLYRGSGNLEWRARDDVTLNLGGAVERYSGGDTQFSPRVFANWQAASGHTLRAGYSRGLRQNNVFARYADIRAIDPRTQRVLVHPYVPNPELKQTRVGASEIGYLGRFDTWNTMLDVRVFEENIHNFVVRVPQPDPDTRPLLSSFLGSTRYENLDSPVRLRGIEYELSTRPRPGTELRLAHAMIDRDSLHPGIEDRSAPYTAAASWIQDWGGGWKSMISVMRMGPLAGGDGYVPRYRFVAKPYTTVDANITYMTRIAGHAVQLGLTAQNIGPGHQEFADRSQQAASGSNDPVNEVCRTAYLSLSIALERGRRP